MKSFMTYLFCLVLIFFVSETADANMAYITNEKDNTVSVLDIKKKKVVKTVEVGQSEGYNNVRMENSFLYARQTMIGSK